MKYIALAFAAIAGVTAQPSLKSLAEAKGRYFGAAIDNGDLSNSKYTAFDAQQFDLTTPGNAMKWGPIEPNRGQFNWSPADAIVSFAQNNNMKLRCHNLVWHSQLPSWVENGSWTASTLTAAIQEHIAAVVGRYKGKCLHWDVVNEPFNEDGTFRSSVFYRVLGQNYFNIALNAAHQADPNAKLYINDYNIEFPGAKSTAMYNLVNSLKSQGVPIDGIGLESHLIVGQVPASSFLSNMQKLASISGIQVAITELDIRMNTPASSSNLAQQKTDYYSVVSACLQVSNCVGIETWGYEDGSSWIPSTFSGQGAALPWDSNYNPKPALTGIYSALGYTAGGSTPTTTAGGSTTQNGGTTVHTTTTATNNGGSCSAKYGQCGGQGFTDNGAPSKPFSSRKKTKAKRPPLRKSSANSRSKKSSLAIDRSSVSSPIPSDDSTPPDSPSPETEAFDVKRATTEELEAREAELQNRIDLLLDEIKTLEEQINGSNGDNDGEEDINYEEFEAPEWCVPIKANVLDFEWDELAATCQFDVISMDPPWQLASSAPTRGVAIGYQQLPDLLIERLPIEKLQTNGFIFIWVINNKYAKAFELMEKWGYTYVDDITWVKQTVNRRMAKGHGYYLQHAKETCLVGRKGTDPPGCKKGIGSDVIFSERRGQSQKPEELYEMIEELVPNGKYLEIFGRKNNLRDFWVTIGNEL
ncbi:hypothetical protein HDV00_002539 [Rhizophlyctis rosea]|nr:hypothetical protein HDV00_002539 [Rhizophlyctis rosea]